MSLVSIVTVIAAWIAFLALIEAKWPVVSGIPLRNYAVNGLCMVVLAAVTVPLSLATGAAAVWAAAAMPAQFHAYRIEDVGVGSLWLDPLLRILVLTLLPLALSDLWMSITHRLEHHSRFMWRFHKVHHSETRLNVMSTFRDHPLQHLWRSFVPMFLTSLILHLNPGNGVQAASYSVVFLYCLSTLAHSNLRLEIPWLDRVLVTPQVHRIHHSTRLEHIDRNYVDVFPVFDILFGSYVAPKRGEFPDTGLVSQERIETFWETQASPFFGWRSRRATRQSSLGIRMADQNQTH